jgi:hypothetical protein
MVAATSSTVMNWFFGIGSSMMRSITSCSLIPCARAWAAICASTSGVRMYAGQTVLTVMSASAVSSASTLLNPSSPCLAAT